MTISQMIFNLLKTHQGRFVVQNMSNNAIVSLMKEFIHQATENYFVLILLRPRPTLPLCAT